jgi:hypothetical protein
MRVQHVSLLEIDPELARLVTPDQAPVATAVRVPVLHVGHGDVPLMDRLEAADALGALVLEGDLVHEVCLWGR